MLLHDHIDDDDDDDDSKDDNDGTINRDRQS